MRWTLAFALCFAAVAADAREAKTNMPGQPDCRAPNAQRAGQRDSAGPKRLGELPDAQLILAVDYREGRCPKPIAVSRTCPR